MKNVDRDILKYICGFLLMINLGTFIYVRDTMDDMRDLQYKALNQFSMVVLSIDTMEELEGLKLAILKRENLIKEGWDDKRTN